MAPPHTHPSTPSHGSTPPVFRQKLKLANAALEKEAAELQHSIAKQDAQIAELAREMERLVTPPFYSPLPHKTRFSFRADTDFVTGQAEAIRSSRLPRHSHKRGANYHGTEDY